MKIAASLALIVAVVSCAWAINDYRDNEESRRYFARQGVTQLFFRNDAGQIVQFDVRKMSDYYERHDAMIGAFSAISFIAAAVLFRAGSTWLRKLHNSENKYLKTPAKQHVKRLFS